MKKIAINRCFGGFSLSPKFYIKYAEALGKKAYFFTGFDDKTLVTPEECEDTLFWSAYTVPNPQDYTKYPEGKRWPEMTKDEKDVYNKSYREISLYGGDIPRDDPLLIKIIEELGDDASGRHGGSVRSEAKAKASRSNGKRGGRPKKKVSVGQ